MLVPSPKWLDSGNNAWQLAAATFVGLQSIPGLAVLYAGYVKQKWAINSAFMCFYAFASVLVVWVLFDYNMAFGEQWFPFLGKPALATSANFLTGQATIPAAASGMPELTFPMATLIFFQFVFAAITVIILGGAVLGRMNFTAWVIFCPVWMTLVYTVGAFSIWGGGWLSQLGVQDFSGGYVIHLAAGASGFVAAAVVGPRLRADRELFPPNSLLVALIGAGLLWLGWNGFNGGDPYFANHDAGAAVLNTNTATAVGLLVWTLMDKMAYGKPSVLGAVNGMIAGLVAITPGAGFVNGWGAIIIGVIASTLVYFALNYLSRVRPFRNVDDTLGVVYTHGFAGLAGGLLVGIFANNAMAETTLAGTISGGGLTLLKWQAITGLWVIVFSAVGTFILLKLVG